MPDQQREELLTLELLEAIEREENISQRGLAEQMGVALGMANSYLKRCVKKGLIKISLAPANRYLYYLTPKGFAEKARLTSEFLSTSLTLFRQARAEYEQLFATLAQQGVQRVWFVGMSDLTEIAYLKLLQSEFELAGVFQPQATIEVFFGAPIVGELPKISDDEVLVITSLEQTPVMLEQLGASISQQQIIVPRFLRQVNYRANNIDAQLDDEVEDKAENVL